MDRHSNKKHKIVRIFGFFLLIALLASAAFGFYRIADTLLNRMFPPVKGNGSSLTGASSASSAPGSLSSGASSGSSSLSSFPEVKGVLSAYGERAKKRLNRMTVKEKVGQVFLFVCPPSGAVKTVDDYQPGGYCLSARDFEGKTPDQVKKTLASYQRSSKIPMLLSCDEEGGTVVRISKYPALSAQKFRSPQEVFQLGGMNGIQSDTVKKAKLMESLGLNLNLAPVCDVSVNPSDYMYARSFGQNAAQTAEFVRISVKAYLGQKLSCTLKHFPGYGNNQDTHAAVVRDKRSYQTFRQYDFLPFQAGIQAGAPCVMVCHNIVECMDAREPASLSPQVHKILRETLGFSGVIMTDDLSMKGVTGYMGGKNPAVAAFQAGNDLLLTSDLSGSFNALYAAVEGGTVTEERLNESVLRILAWKYSMRLLS